MKWAVVGSGGVWMTVAGVLIHEFMLSGVGLGLVTLALLATVWRE